MMSNWHWSILAQQQLPLQHKSLPIWSFVGSKVQNTLMPARYQWGTHSWIWTHIDLHTKDTNDLRKNEISLESPEKLYGQVVKTLGVRSRRPSLLTSSAHQGCHAVRVIGQAHPKAYRSIHNHRACWGINMLATTARWTFQSSQCAPRVSIA